jgi:AraC-like DNA-binding protein
MEIIYIGAVFCALLTAILILKNETVYQLFSDRLLAIYLIAASYCATLYILVKTGQIIEVPYLFKTAAPLNFILPPLAYFYTKSVLKNQSGFDKGDLLHFAPFVVMLINYLPFYFLPMSEKLEIITSIGINNWSGTGFINEDQQFIMRELQLLIYLIFQWKLIAEFKSANDSVVLHTHTFRVLAWLKAFTGLTTINFFCIVAAVFTLKIYPFGDWTTTMVEAADILYGSTYFILCSYLLLNPSVLYGLPFLLSPENAAEKSNYPPAQIVQTNVEYESMLDQLLLYFEEKQPFLQKKISISEVSVVLKISPRNVSFILNTYKGLRFNDFVNNYRIDFIISNISEGYLKNYTLESLAKRAGFSNYSTFYRAFLRFKGVTPTEFLEKLGK